MATPTNLFEYFQQKGQALPSVSERRTMFGLGQGYTGSEQQNIALLNKLLSPTPIVTVGPTPVSVPTPAPVTLTAPPPPPVAPVSPTPPATDLTLGTVETPELPTLPTIADTKAYTEGMLKDLETKKQQVLDAYNKQREDITKSIETSKKEVEDLLKAQAGVIEDTGPLLAPFREKLETSERERLKVEENYFANQQLVGELESLLTNLQSEVATAEAQTGLAAIRNPRIAKLKEDVAARVGIIQATMNARTGQIDMAFKMIDRSVDAITKDRSDQLAYYKKVYDFYGEQKDTEGAKLIQLTKDEKDFAEKQIKFLESEVKVSQDNVDYIKDLLVNPDDAAAMARAGVNLNMTIPEINAALAKDAYRQEVIKISNDAAKDGFQYLSSPEQIKIKQADPKAEVRTMTDSKGKTYSYWKEAEAPTPTPIIEEEPSITLQRILQGVGSINNLTPSERQKVENEAFERGLYNETPPDWFRKQAEEILEQPFLPERVKELWNEFRAPLTATGERTTGGGGGLNYDNY